MIRLQSTLGRWARRLGHTSVTTIAVWTPLLLELGERGIAVFVMHCPASWLWGVIRERWGEEPSWGLRLGQWSVWVELW